MLAAAALLSGCGGHDPAPAAARWFTDVAAQAGLDFEAVSGSPTVDYIIESLGSGAGWLDYDGDGDLDLYLAQGATLQAPGEGPPDRLLRNRGDGTFEDVTEAGGLGDRAWSFGVAVGDIEGDGDPDLYVTQWGPNRLYRNDGDGAFTEIGPAAGVADPGLGASAAWSDIDHDGDLDLFVTNYVAFDATRYPARGEPLARSRFACSWRGMDVFCGPRNLEPAVDRLFRNDGDPDGDGVPAFSEIGERLAGLSASFGLGACFFDADGDGDDDLYVANDSVANAFFINRGDGRFDEGALYAGLAFNEEGHEQAGMGVAAGDYDGDAAIDLVVTNFSHDHDTLYHNERDGYFLDLSFAAGIGTPSFLTLGWGVGLHDFDRDGRTDLFVAHGHVYPQVDGRGLGTTFRQEDTVFRNIGDGSFEPLPGSVSGLDARLDSSRAAAFADYDLDGDVDVLVTAHNGRPALWRNDGATGAWLAVRALGAGGSPAIGAQVRVDAGGVRHLREVRRDGSFLASSTPVAHFGLGDATSVERLEVRFPGGRTVVVERPGINRYVVVREDGP